MNKAGYSRAFNGAITSAASTTGLLIPPSNTLIVYAVASGGVSISALFVAGYIPGLLLGIALMVVCAVFAARVGFPRGQRLPLSQGVRKIADAGPSLLMVVIGIGGILGGLFTSTEAGAIAVVYSLVLSVLVYRELSPAQLHPLLWR